MKRFTRWACIAAFLAMCAGVVVFLHAFTQAESPFVYPAWETGAVVSADGAETPFDPVGPLPELDEGESWRFSLTLPQGRSNGQILIFEATGLEAAAFLDGTELWYSTSVLPEGTVNQGQAYIPLPAGGGEILTMDLRPLSDTALLPPMPRLTNDPGDQAGAIAYANLYSLPAGASALALVLLWGLFLLSLVQGKRPWPLLLLVLAAAALVVYRISSGFGAYFLPDWAVRLGSGLWLGELAFLALAAYLVFHRERAFWRALGLAAMWSGAALLLAVGISYLTDGYLIRYLPGLATQMRQGQLDGALYWLTAWLVLVCAALSAWELARSILRTQSEAQALSLKNQLVMDNYRAIKEKLRESGQLRHEAVHRLTALDALVQARDWEGVERVLTAWHQESAAVQTRFTEHLAVNAILQHTAGQAETLGIDLRTSVALPESLAIPDEDLCALLMNLLDNALEGASRTPEGQTRFILFQMRVAGNFVPILCENSFDGHVATDEAGVPVTTKPNPNGHGFGMTQMRAVAEKYGSVLDVSWTEDRFTVQTAPQLPR